MSGSRNLVAPRIAAPDVPTRLEAGPPLAPLCDHLRACWTQTDTRTDATRGDFAECRFDGIRADLLTLENASLVDVVVTDAVITQLSARGGRWRDVQVTGGRIATLDLSDAHLDNVELRGVHIDYLTLGAARVRDVLIADCTIGALDLPRATVTRMAFESTRCDEMDPRGMRAEHLDLRGLDAASFVDPAGLRGATMRDDQVALHAASFAASLGIRIDG